MMKEQPQGRASQPQTGQGGGAEQPQDSLTGHVVQPLERLVVAVLVAALGGIIVWDGSRQVGESAYFPLVVGATLVLLSLCTILSFKRVCTRTDEAPLAKGLFGLVLAAVFVALAENIGFLTASILLIPAMAWLGGIAT